MHFNMSPVHKQHDFHCLTYPALDVCGFNQLKKAFCGLLVKCNMINQDCLTKANIMEVLGPAYYAALTPENVKAGFKATGIHPFNPEAITEDKLAPSLATAKKTHSQVQHPLQSRKPLTSCSQNYPHLVHPSNPSIILMPFLMPKKVLCI
jgi:hypothetical protein